MGWFSKKDKKTAEPKPARGSQQKENSKGGDGKNGARSHSPAPAAGSPGHNKNGSRQQDEQAAVKIQAAMRGHKVRSELKRQSTAATLIQSRYRGFAQRKDNDEKEKAATKIASLYRGYSDRKLTKEIRRRNNDVLALSSNAQDLEGIALAKLAAANLGSWEEKVRTYWRGFTVDKSGIRNPADECLVFAPGGYISGLGKSRAGGGYVLDGVMNKDGYITITMELEGAPTITFNGRYVRQTIEGSWDCDGQQGNFRWKEHPELRHYITMRPGPRAMALLQGVESLEAIPIRQAKGDQPRDHQQIFLPTHLSRQTCTNVLDATLLSVLNRIEAGELRVNPAFDQQSIVEVRHEGRATGSFGANHASNPDNSPMAKKAAAKRMAAGLPKFIAKPANYRELFFAGKYKDAPFQAPSKLPPAPRDPILEILENGHRVSSPHSGMQEIPPPLAKGQAPPAGAIAGGSNPFNTKSSLPPVPAGQYAGQHAGHHDGGFAGSSFTAGGFYPGGMMNGSGSFGQGHGGGHHPFRGGAANANSSNDDEPLLGKTNSKKDGTPGPPRKASSLHAARGAVKMKLAAAAASSTSGAGAGTSNSTSPARARPGAKDANGSHDTAAGSGAGGNGDGPRRGAVGRKLTQSMMPDDPSADAVLHAQGNGGAQIWQVQPEPGINFYDAQQSSYMLMQQQQQMYLHQQQFMMQQQLLGQSGGGAYPVNDPYFLQLQQLQQHQHQHNQLLFQQQQYQQQMQHHQQLVQQQQQYLQQQLQQAR